jgi:hypothetical protein
MLSILYNMAPARWIIFHDHCIGDIDYCFHLQSKLTLFRP